SGRAIRQLHLPRIRRCGVLGGLVRRAQEQVRAARGDEKRLAAVDDSRPPAEPAATLATQPALSEAAAAPAEATATREAAAAKAAAAKLAAAAKPAAAAAEAAAATPGLG